MFVHVREMTNTEYDTFCAWSFSSQTQDYVDISGLSHEAARKQAMVDMQQMLPDGRNTVDHRFMSIEISDSKEIVGFIWVLFEETNGRKQTFLCDFLILESHRRKGYATTALSMLSRYSIDIGCDEIVLFVSDQNTAARKLYEKCGYRFLRKAKHGQYLVKTLY